MWGDWPVPSGFGKSTLDFIGCINGRFFSVETKAPGKVPTRRQENIIEAIHRAGGKTFIIDGDVEELKQYLDEETNGPR